MYCARCGRQIDEDSTFCKFCGQEVRVVPASFASAERADSAVSALETEASQTTGASCASQTAACCACAQCYARYLESEPLRTFFVWNCLATALCFWPTGLVGLYFSWRSSQTRGQGLLDQSRRYAKFAQRLFWTTVALGVCFGLLAELLRLGMSSDALAPILERELGEWVLVFR